MYLYLGRSGLQDWMGTTAYLSARAVAEWACWVHSDYVLLCGCSSEGLGSGAEAVLLLCSLPPLLLFGALTLHWGLALWRHGSSGAQRGPSGLHDLCIPLGWHSINLPHSGFALWYSLPAPLKPLSPPASISPFPDSDQNQLSAPVTSPFPHSQGSGQDAVQSALGSSKSGPLPSLVCPDEGRKVKGESLPSCFWAPPLSRALSGYCLLLPCLS